MSSPSSSSPSPINQMFDGRSVFITGASGFIGRVLLEKLLRTYPGIVRVYILMRAKKNVAPRERLTKQLLAAPIFDEIKSIDRKNFNNGNFHSLIEKIHLIEGDIALPNLGISPEDFKMLLEDKTLSIVYHSAATVKFDEPLKTSTEFNLIATKSVVELCKQLKNLVALCHVSTAYVNSDIKDSSLIEEKVYPMDQTPEQIIEIVKSSDPKSLQQIKSKLVGERPNTYTYTKALAENLILQEASELPVAIVRPSIVVAAWKEPIPGWVENLNGPTGLILAIGKGLLRSLYLKREVVADIIPVDICVNTMIAASYYTAKEHDKLAETTKLPPVAAKKHQNKEANKIFHCTSGDTNRITWGQMEDMFWPIILRYPSQQVLRYPGGSFKGNYYHDMITRFFVHYLPALFIDLLCMILGKKRQLLSIYRRLHVGTSSLTYFMTTNFNFKTQNLALLERCLSDERDKRDLPLSIKDLNWYDFWDAYVLGARRFVLKEKDETLESSRKSFARAYHMEIAFRAVMAILLGVVCMYIVTRMTSIPDMYHQMLAV